MTELLPDPEPVAGVLLEAEQWRAVTVDGRILGHIHLTEWGFHVAGRIGDHPTRAAAVQELLRHWEPVL